LNCVSKGISREKRAVDPFSTRVTSSRSSSQPYARTHAHTQPNKHTQLSGKPDNVAKKASKEKVIDLYNKVFDEGLVASEEDREAARWVHALSLPVAHDRAEYGLTMDQASMCARVLLALAGSCAGARA